MSRRCNLEVTQDHTYTVGADQFVVHNCAKGIEQSIGPLDSCEQARNSAFDILGDLGQGSKPYVSRLGDRQGLIVGRQSADGLARWRLDFDLVKGPHINVGDFRSGKGMNGAIKVAVRFSGDENTVTSLLRHLNR